MTDNPRKKRPVKTAKDITKKSKPAEETLEQSERKYKALIDTTGTGYVILDSNGKVLDANPEYVRLTGHKSLDEIAGRSVVEWTAPHHRGKNIIEVKKCIEKGFVRNLEVDYIDQTGHITPIEINATLLESNEGHYILTIVRDITERKKAEDDLRKNEERFRALIEHSHDAITLLTADGTVLYDSPSIVHVLGYSPTERIGRSVFEFVHPEERQDMAHGFAKFVQQPGAVDPSEARFLHKDGTIRQIEGMRTNLLYESTVSAVVVNYRDITARKRAAEALYESEGRFRAIFDNASDGILVADPETKRFYLANKTICQKLGYSEEEIKNLGIQDIHPEEDLPYVMEQFNKIIRREIELAMDIPMQRKDRSVFYTDVNSFPLIIDGKQYIIGLFRDITERKKAEEILKEKDRELEIKSKNLEETNIALKVLLRRTDEDRAELEAKVLLNVRELVIPYLKKLKISSMDETQRTFVNILESNLLQIISPFSHRMSSKLLNFTPTEIQVADLLRKNKTSKEIGELLNASPRTIAFHRDNIRNKLGLKNKKTNLKSYLSSLQ